MWDSLPPRRATLSLTEQGIGQNYHKDKTVFLTTPYACSYCSIIAVLVLIRFHNT